MDKIRSFLINKNGFIFLLIFYVLSLFAPYYRFPIKNGPVTTQNGWNVLIGSRFPSQQTLKTILEVDSIFSFYSQFIAFCLFLLLVCLSYVLFSKKRVKSAITLAILGLFSSLYVALFDWLLAMQDINNLLSILEYGYYLSTLLSFLVVAYLLLVTRKLN
ncbi:MAG: hypothetical protein ACI31W_05845 [Lactococcus sp.]